MAISVIDFVLLESWILALFGAALAMPAIVAERMFATAFVVDYEKRRRFYIPIIILILQWSISIAISFVNNFCKPFFLCLSLQLKYTKISPISDFTCIVVIAFNLFGLPVK